MASATLGFRARFLSFTRPRAVLNRMWVPSVSNHTGVTWGAPSGLTVASMAKAFFCKNPCTIRETRPSRSSFLDDVKVWHRPARQGASGEGGPGIGERARPGLGETAQSQEQADEALLDELRVLGGGIRHPLAGPVPLLRLKSERGRQGPEAQEQVVGRQARRAQPRDHRAAHGGIPDSGERLDQRRVARRVRALS